MERDPFPLDLIRTQTAWTDTYAALANAGTGSTTALRRQLLRLSVQLWWHPYWDTPTVGPADRVALREHVRTGHGEEAKAA
ncbi:hypothetical protein ACFCZ2_29820 [Streptomyces sp. NPDC056202]|uniref:hypothetical protein n=1 Tax=unclassified Streptomyces TaxID=2593676 RepID=UPI0035D90515